MKLRLSYTILLHLLPHILQNTICLLLVFGQVYSIHNKEHLVKLESILYPSQLN